MRAADRLTTMPRHRLRAQEPSFGVIPPHQDLRTVQQRPTSADDRLKRALETLQVITDARAILTEMGREDEQRRIAQAQS